MFRAGFIFVFFVLLRLSRGLRFVLSGSETELIRELLRNTGVGTPVFSLIARFSEGLSEVAAGTAEGVGGWPGEAGPRRGRGWAGSMASLGVPTCRRYVAGP